MEERGPEGARARPTLVSVAARDAGRRHAGQSPRIGRAAARGVTPKVRGERTRRRIAESVISLMEEQQQPPTAKEVAARAGVSVRLIFHHFEDMDTLYKMVAGMQFERHWKSLDPVPAELPLDQRIERTVARRAKLFDSIAPVRRTAIVLAARFPEQAAGLSESDRLLRDWTSLTFSSELSAAGRERRDLQAALDTVLSFETWERLRHAQGLSNAAARRVMNRTVRALLGS